MNTPTIQTMFALLVLLGLVVSITLVLNLAKLSGWKRIAAEYATRTFPDQSLEGWVTARVGPFLYRNLVVAADQRGFYVRTVRGTSVFHTPICVPWEDVSISEGRNLWFRMIRFNFRKAAGRSFLLSPDLARKVLERRPA